MKDVIMPKFGFTQEEGQIVRWLKRAGDVVVQGEPIVEVTTDKTNMEVEAPASGTLAALRYAEGDTVKVTDVIATILAEGESPAPLPHGEGSGGATPVAQRVAKEHGLDLTALSGSGPNGRITRGDVERALATPDARPRATPAARAAARDAGLSLAELTGSGPNGRVQAADVAAEVQQRAAPPDRSVRPTPLDKLGANGLADLDRVLPFTGMRRTIADRLQRSAQQAPHATFDVDVETTAFEALRARVGTQAGQRIGITAVLAKACGWALQRHPRINSQLDVAAQHIKLMRAVNIGIAVALDDGLIVPVLHDVPSHGLMSLSAQIADLGARAKAGRLKPAELQGGTFTISNLGMFGVDRFTAIINPPESAILAAGRAAPRFVADAEGAPVLRNVMTLRLSADHRVIDGAVAAAFMRDLRAALEAPELMLA